MRVLKSCCLLFALVAASRSAIAHVPIENYCAYISLQNPGIEYDKTRERLKTKNNFGGTYCFLTPLAEEFLEFCRKISNPRVLEVGAAYGVKSSQIVQTGASLVALDIGPEHIDVMNASFSHFSKNEPSFRNVEYLVGDISNFELSTLGTYDAIIVESVLHFFAPEKVRAVLSNLKSLLNPGGRLYLLTSSPYLLNLSETYQQNQEKGLEWPGFFEDPATIHPSFERLHKPYHFFSDAVLGRELIRAGFKIIEMKYVRLPHNENELQLDGREGLSVIAE